MKLKSSFLLILAVASFNGFSQGNKDLKDIKYRRSSLHTILIESDNFPKKEEVIKAYYSAPFPEKYDNHNIGVKSFDGKKYGAKEGASEEETIAMIDQYLKSNKIANKMVAKWFNRKANGTFDIQLITERGLINASFTDMKTAAASAEGNALLVTAGLELLNNTFVVVSKMKFIENEPVARVARDAAILTANKLSVAMLRTKAIAVADKAYDKGKEGYSVWTTSFLYKLKWDDATSNTFYQDYWLDNAADPTAAAKKAKFDSSDLFQLEFVGSESATSLVTFSLSQKRTENEIIDLSVVRNIDNVYAKLQKKYDVFKTKVPLYSVSPLKAKIGMKEGLEGGEKFEVLEANMDPKTGIIEYKKKGTIKVDKDNIWDNRFNAGFLEEDNEGGSKKALDGTLLEGGGKFYSGMLIRQIN
ncbi:MULTISPECIES: hypothetical protein [unclassified Flavobacterium]|uniref:hypothetical protein n=1 Tax=unclassified Flavobacterium TaxID=196869 RepID=UPI00156EEB64|nr:MULTISPECIES: hypothetical protein [unclassified Flavobacterium]MBE0392094.1 hypothetical protein [Flavobacterium sp. PL002]NRT14556.1 hypothetical protein [Flavobacterium sp. 28A]